MNGFCCILSVTVGALLVVASPSPASAESYRKLGGPKISQTLSGMEYTDEVHWAYVFARGGKLTSVAMGKRSTGTWRVQRDELCLAMPTEQERCYEAWISGKSLQLRQPGFDLSEDGILQRPSQRN